MDITILIDFGMTASAAECLVTSPIDKVKKYSFDKTPTRLLYGEDGTVIAWGDNCLNETGVTKEFKKYLFSNAGGLTSGDDQLPRVEVEKARQHFTDYLYQFCKHILDHISSKEHTIIEQLNIKWYLTAPDAWSDPSQRDFHMLAEKVLTRLVPGSAVFLDITESRASCEFLTDYFDLKDGTWALTCDIGGLTLDIALSIISTSRERAIPQVFAISGDRNGSIGIIDSEFERRIRDLLLEGLHDQSKIGKELAQTADWHHARHAFDGSEDVKLSFKNGHVKFLSVPGVLIDGGKITISSEVMQSVFEPFFDTLWKGIDASLSAVKKVTPRATTPAIIALSGGGATMAYLRKQIMLRYPEMELKVPATTQESRLATVIGHRIFRERENFDKYIDGIILGVSGQCVSQEPDYSIRWEKDSGRVTTFELGSRKHRVLHYVLVCSKRGTSRPASLSELKSHSQAWKEVLVWELEVTLDRHLIQRNKYVIEATCIGNSIFSFRAYDARDPRTTFAVASRIHVL